MSEKEKTKQAYSPLRDFTKKFLKQRVAVGAFFIVMAIIIVSLIAPWIVPYDPDRPVTVQYEEKGIDYQNMTSTKLSLTPILSNGEVKKGMIRPRVESGNRRIASGRAVRDGIKITAVNPGQTYVLVRLDDVSALIDVTVSTKENPIPRQLVASVPDQNWAVGKPVQIDLKGVLSDGRQIIDVDQIVAMTKEVLEENVQDTSGGWGFNQKEPVKLKYESLTPEIVKVSGKGEVTTLAPGFGQVKVSIGDLSTVVGIGVEETVKPIVTQLHVDSWQVKLKDIYKHQPPSRRHWFGTDHQNRDIFSRVLVGTRATLLIGFISVFIGTFIGTILGLLAGYYGGWVDNLLTRFCDVLLAFPGILLAIAVIALLGPGLTNIIFAVATFTVPIFLRIVRGSALELKNMTYVEAAHSIGVKDIVIILRHIFPGTLSIVMVYLTMRIGTAILIGASLSFLGLGGDITAPEWGAMLSAAKDNSRNFFHPTFFPGLAIVITVLSFNLLGDGLRDALDPKIND